MRIKYIDKYSVTSLVKTIYHSIRPRCSCLHLLIRMLHRQSYQLFNLNSIINEPSPLQGRGSSPGGFSPRGFSWIAKKTAARSTAGFWATLPIPIPIPCIQANPHVCGSSLPTVRTSIKCNVWTLGTHSTCMPDKKNIIKYEKNDETSTVRWRVWTYHPSVSNIRLRVRLKHLTDISRMSAGSSLYNIGPRYRIRRLPASVPTDGRRKSSSWRVVRTRASRFVWMEVEMDTGVLYTRILCSNASV